MIPLVEMTVAGEVPRANKDIADRARDRVEGTTVDGELGDYYGVIGLPVSGSEIRIGSAGRWQDLVGRIRLSPTTLFFEEQSFGVNLAKFFRKGGLGYGVSIIQSEILTSGCCNRRRNGRCMPVQMQDD